MSSIVTPTGLEQAGLMTVQSEGAAVDTTQIGTLEPTPEQIRYANLLEKGMRLGLASLFVTFPLYVFGIIDPHVPLEKVQYCWTLGVHDYYGEANVKPGWAWMSLLGHGDFLNFVGIVILAAVTTVCYLAIIPSMFRRRDTIYAVLAVLQVVILGLAASGLIAVGH